MTTVLQCSRKTANPFASALGLTSLAWILLLTAWLRVFGVSLIPAALAFGELSHVELKDQRGFGIAGG